MFHLLSILRLVAAAWRGPRDRARPSRSRPSLELLPDRILPSVAAGDPTAPEPYQKPNDRDLAAQVRVIELSGADAPGLYQESGPPAPLPQPLLDALGGPAGVAEVPAPTVTHGTIERDGQTFTTVDLNFGASVTVRLVFYGNDDGLSAEADSGDYGGAPLVAGRVDVDSGGAETRFLLTNDRGPEYGLLGAPPLIPLPDASGRPEAAWARPAPYAPSAADGQDWAASACSSDMNCPSMTAFVDDRPGARQTAGGTGARAENDGADGTAQDAAASDDPADVLLTVDAGLPNFNADLNTMRKADLAVVPTYVVAAAPAAPPAHARVADPFDPQLEARVVGLDESPAGSAAASRAADEVFERLGTDGRRALDTGAIQITEAAAARPPVPETEGGLGVRAWLDVLVREDGKGAAAIPTLALEGLLAYVYYRGGQSGRRATTLKRLKEGSRGAT